MSVYLAGYTLSYNFPTVNPYQAEFNPGTEAINYEAFACKLSSSGSVLDYSTYLGGIDGDFAAAGLWSVRGITRFYFGGTADSAVPGDYAGDGVFAAGVFRPSSGLWAILNTTRVYLGLGTDSPCPADYDGSGRDAAGIYRFSEGLWAVPGITRIYFGGSDDIPMTR